MDRDGSHTSAIRTGRRKSIATPEIFFLINPATAGYPLSIILGHRKAVLESKVLTKQETLQRKKKLPAML
ncbi:hypothetical protein Nmel_017892 [Mimus melanotis]